MCLQTVHEFKQPQGTAKEDIDASGDGEVPAVLHLKPDDSLVEQGLAREVINRVQKLRKQAGLVAIDVVDVFVEVPADAGRHVVLPTLSPSLLSCLLIIHVMLMTVMDCIHL